MPKFMFKLLLSLELKLLDGVLAANVSKQSQPLNLCHWVNVIYLAELFLPLQPSSFNNHQTALFGSSPLDPVYLKCLQSEQHPGTVSGLVSFCVLRHCLLGLASQSKSWHLQ